MLELRIEKKGTFGAEGTMVAGNGRVALLDWILKTDCEELLQFFNPSEVLLLESNKKQVYLFGSLLICGIIVESLPTARCAPKCEKTVQALLCQNLNVKLATLLNAISSRRIRLQDDIVTSFHFSVSEIFLTVWWIFLFIIGFGFLFICLVTRSILAHAGLNDSTMSGGKRV